MPGTQCRCWNSSERTAHQGTPLPDGDRRTRQKATEEETFPDKQTRIIFHFTWLALQVHRTDGQTEPKTAPLIPLLFLPAHLCSSPCQIPGFDQAVGQRGGHQFISCLVTTCISGHLLTDPLTDGKLGGHWERGQKRAGLRGCGFSRGSSCSQV